MPSANSAGLQPDSVYPNTPSNARGHGYHGVFRTAVRAYNGVYHAREDKERKARKNEHAVFLCVGQNGGAVARSPEKFKYGVHKNKTYNDKRYARKKPRKQTRAYGSVRCRRVVLALVYAYHRRRAVAYEQPERKRYHRKGIYHARCGVPEGQIAALTYEYLVYYIV